MTWVQLPLWGEAESEPPEAAGFMDVLFTPSSPPEPDPELSPEEEQLELFHAETDGQYTYANPEPGDWHRAGRDQGEVCILAGWPPRHQQVGRHCPHGLSSPGGHDGGDGEVIDYTRGSHRSGAGDSADDRGDGR